jgi:hypothetical protein
MTLSRWIYLIAVIALALWLRDGYNEDKQFVKEYEYCVSETNQISNCLDELDAKRKALKKS